MGKSAMFGVAVRAAERVSACPKSLLWRKSLATLETHEGKHKRDCPECAKAGPGIFCDARPRTECERTGNPDTSEYKNHFCACQHGCPCSSTMVVDQGCACGGTNEDGTASEATCNNWTNGTADSTGMLGHADRIGMNPGLNPWNAAHPSRGCDMASLIPTGGAGMFYCFAID